MEDDVFTPPRWLELLRLINIFGQHCQAGEEDEAMKVYRKIRTEMKRLEKGLKNEI